MSGKPYCWECGCQRDYCDCDAWQPKPDWLYECGNVKPRVTYPALSEHKSLPGGVT